MYQNQLTMEGLHQGPESNEEGHRFKELLCDDKEEARMM